MNIKSITMLAIGMLVAAYVLPNAVVQLTNTTLWTGAPSAVLSIVPVLGIVAVVALLIMIIRHVT